MLEVLEPGLRTTVEDLGRPGWCHLGVPVGGVADAWSARVANLVADNPPDAAVLEIVLAGPRLRALAPVTVALAGADLGASIPRGAAVRLARGDELAIPGPATRGGGARAYLAVAGGIDVPPVLGSRATCEAGRFGGLDGRPLRPGDRLRVGRPRGGVAHTGLRLWPGDPSPPRRPSSDGATLLRVLPGLVPAPGLAGATFRVGAAFSAMGLSLDPPLDVPVPHVTSHGVVHGAIQLPPDGHPIVLLAAAQPTGGYPVVGVVATVDLAVLGQLAPGDPVRFEPVDLTTARAALLEQDAGFVATRTAFMEAATSASAGPPDELWDELSRGAGG